MRSRTAIGACCAVGSVLVFGVGVAIAATSSDPIHGCVANATGVLRIAAACNATESELSWNHEGPAGPVGPAGPTGAPGAQGPAGVSGYEIVSVTKQAPPSWATRIGYEVACPAGKTVIGGGYDLGKVESAGAGGTDALQPIVSKPFSSSNGLSGWQLQVSVHSTTAPGPTIYAICAST